jgi:acetyl esterase/lipase
VTSAEKSTAALLYLVCTSAGNTASVSLPAQPVEVQAVERYIIRMNPIRALKAMKPGRALLALGLLGLVAAAPVPAAMAQETKSRKQTFTYKTVQNCAIQVDVYSPAGAAPHPVAIWIHGGALIMGNRAGIDHALLDKLLAAGYVVVSIDYRLAPEAKLSAILEDLEDACKWVREKGPELFAIDAKKLAIMGGSAGGYLTLVAGYRVHPRPVALVSFWGYGDVAGAWYSQPDPFYSRMPRVSKEEAYKVVGRPVRSGSTGRDNRGSFYLYCRQQGLWPKEVTGYDPAKEPQAFDAFCPLRNVSRNYPPTLLIHGTNDTDVPYEQSELMAKELTRQGVEHELITVKDAGHGLAGAKPDVVAATRDRAVAFLNKHMR